MITKIEKIHSPDLFEKNKSLNLDMTRALNLCSDLPDVSALTLLQKRTDFSISLGDMAANCADSAFRLIQNNWTDYNYWLFLSHSAWLPINRITLYKKLWKSEIGTIEWADKLVKTEELEIRSEEGVRFSGAIKLTENTLLNAIDFNRTDLGSFIFFTRKKTRLDLPQINTLFHAGFSPKGKEKIPDLSIDWLNLILHIGRTEDLLFRVWGMFDNKEAAVDIIGNYKSISSLV